MNGTVKALGRWLALKGIAETAEWWLRWALPLAAIILAIYSIHMSNDQLQLARRAQELTITHYFEIEEPAVRYQRVSHELTKLREKIELAEQLITESEIPEAGILELEQALRRARRHGEETDKALGEYRLTDAESYVLMADQGVDKVLRELSDRVFEVPVVTVWATGFLQVGINITAGTTKEGEPLDAVTIAMADPPISSGYPHRVVYCYDISPDGAEFDDPARFTFSYDPDDIPFGCYEEDLAVAAWDWHTEEWRVLGDSRVDARRDSISVTVNPLSRLAVIAQYPKLAQPVGWVPISAVVLGLPFLVKLGVVSIVKRRQRDGRALLRCRPCRRRWHRRGPGPRRCPRCHSRNWNR